MEDASVEPTVMPLDLLRQITDGFSEERMLGAGSFGKVYLGEHQDGRKIAVKKLYDMPGLDDKQFLNEYKNLTRLRHKNIVRLVGYCRDIQEVHVMYEGKLFLAERAHRALCLEYMSNGRLEKYLSDECDRYDWHTGYRIIKGICHGLKYLHNELKPPIYHLDLKPANVLLDENMVPRIADFGMSRLFRDEHTRSTKSSVGTIGYLPPEYIKKSLISNKFDIFSLGVVIIKIMAGRAGYFNSAEISSREFINLVLENWTNRLPEILNQRNAYSEQVKICIEIGLNCVQEDRHKRPTIQDIVSMLEETETKCTYAARKNWPLNFQEVHRKTFPQYALDPNDLHDQQIYHGSTFNQNIVATTHSNYLDYLSSSSLEEIFKKDSQFCLNDDQEYSADGGPLPVIERFQMFDDPRPGFQIFGDPKLGSTLSARGLPINDAKLGKFQWFRYLEHGTRQLIEGATMDDYVVTAEDVDTLLAVDFTPMGDNGHQGHLVMEFANTRTKVTCDRDMQIDINTCITRGGAFFDIFVLGCFTNEWKKASLALRRDGYRITFSHNKDGPLDEVYSPMLQMKIPKGRTTRFVLVNARGVNRPFNTRGVTHPNNEDDDVRLRDLIVLVMRAFRDEALNSRESGSGRAGADSSNLA
uniref:Uncharacterized protein n=1 Tax=Avena sativa TaxID=4498 RepID=A0ACD5ZDR4_AVESA